MNHVLWQAPYFFKGPNHFLNPLITFGGAGTPSENLEQERCRRRGGGGRELHTFCNREESIQNFAFLHFFWEVLAPTPGINLIDIENSSDEISFESVHIYPELKHLKAGIVQTKFHQNRIAFSGRAKVSIFDNIRQHHETGKNRKLRTFTLMREHKTEYRSQSRSNIVSRFAK